MMNSLPLCNINIKNHYISSFHDRPELCWTNEVNRLLANGAMVVIHGDSKASQILVNKNNKANLRKIITAAIQELQMVEIYIDLATNPMKAKFIKKNKENKEVDIQFFGSEKFMKAMSKKIKSMHN